MLPTHVSRFLWVAMIGLVVVLGIRFRDDIEIYFEGVGTLAVRDAPEDDTVYLTWRGNIEAPMESRLNAAYRQYRDTRRRFVLALSSPGGSLSHGARVVRLLNDIAERHDLETVVEARRRCASMCVPVYLQGETRIAARTARFMFHEVRFSEYFSDEDANVPASARGTATDQLFARYFKPAGVPETWIRQVRADMAGDTDVWKTGSELVDDNAGIVQVLK